MRLSVSTRTLLKVEFDAGRYGMKARRFRNGWRTINSTITTSALCRFCDFFRTQITQIHTDLHFIICVNLCASMFVLPAFYYRKVCYHPFLREPAGMKNGWRSLISKLSRGTPSCISGTKCIPWRFCACGSCCSLPPPSGRRPDICHNGCTFPRRSGCGAGRSSSWV